MPPEISNSYIRKLSLKTPVGHGEILLWPDLNQIKSSLQDNVKYFSHTDIEIGERGLHDCREQAKKELLRLARDYGRKLKLPEVDESDGPLVVAGHQCQLFHAGILAKYVLGEELARYTGGIFLNLVADNDLPKNTVLQIPTASEDGLKVESAAVGRFDPQLPMEYQALPTADVLYHFFGELDRLSRLEKLGGRVDGIARAFNDAYRLSENPCDLFTLLNHHLAERLGLNWLELPVSVMSETAGFAGFVADFLFDSDKVRRCYNQALDHYRRAYKIRSQARPMHNLVGDENGDGDQETPFWLFRPDGRRQPLFVRSAGDELMLGNGKEISGRLGGACRDNPVVMMQALKEQGLHVRPRALTLTIFGRLFLADYFVHGIGGAQYDQVADEFIRQFYGIEPPAYACASATLHLLPGDYETVDDVRRRIHQIHLQQRDLQYNPQRYIEGKPELLKQREEAIEESRRLLREGGAHQVRREVFERIRHLNEKIESENPAIRDNLERDKRDAEKQLHEAYIAHDREYFFGLLPEKDLRRLVEQFSIE